MGDLPSQVKLAILSDSNQFYIEEILEANNLAFIFQHIVTNPAVV